MSARDELRRYVSLLGDMWTPRETTDARVEALHDVVRAEVLAADGQAYDGELAMLRHLTRRLRVAARQSDLGEVQRLLIDHAVEDAAARAEAAR